MVSFFFAFFFAFFLGCISAFSYWSQRQLPRGHLVWPLILLADKFKRLRLADEVDLVKHRCDYVAPRKPAT